MAKMHINENELKRLIFNETMKAVSDNGGRIDENWFNSKLTNSRKKLANSNVYSDSIDELGPRELFNFATSYRGGRKFLRSADINSWADFLHRYNEDEDFKYSLRVAIGQEYANQQTKAAKEYNGDTSQLNKSDYAQTNNRWRENYKKLLESYKSLQNNYYTVATQYNDQLEDLNDIAAKVGVASAEEDNYQTNHILEAIQKLQNQVAQLTKANRNLTTQVKQLTAQTGQQQTQIAQNNAQMYNDQVYAQQKATALSDPSGTKAGQMLNNQVTQQNQQK